MAHAFDPAVSAAAAHRDLDPSVIRQARIARAAGDAAVRLLKNHGPLVLGPSIAEAWDDLYYLERAAEVQLKAMASGRPLKPVAPASRCCRATPPAPGCIWSA